MLSPTLRSSLLATLLATAASAALGQSAAAPAPTAAGPRAVNEADRVVLKGNVPARARPQLEVGRADANLPMERMILQLALRPGARAQLDQLLAAQQNPASPRYHQWLTPEEFAARFGAQDADVQTVTAWLTSHGFTIDEVARGRGWINFSGVAAQVEKTFATEIHDYQVGGKLYHANSIDPSIPRGLADVVAGVVSLHSFQRPPRLISTHPLPDAGGLKPRTTLSEGNFLAPADFATIYDLNQAYNAGTNGTGAAIAIMARSDIELSDVQLFRSSFGLPANNPVFIHNGKDPGVSCPDPNAGCDEQESDLDTEWAGAVAPGATVDLVISATTNATDGILLSEEYAVDHNVAAVATVSYGLCEAQQGSTEITFYDNLLAQGAAEGITHFAAAGDSGAADCDDPGSTTGTGRAVDFPCSSPNNTCAGGTQFNDVADPSLYWSPTNNPVTQGSALSYIPELVWNESGKESGGTGLLSTGGGASTFFAKPSWQAAPGVPADGMRDVPDVALSTAGHDGYLVYSEGQLGAFEGTSTAAPSFAGLAALVVQKTGARLGNINPILYQLGASQYGASGPAVFHDIKTGNNSVPGVTGYNAGPGYDQTTGLGSVDGQTLLSQWPGGSGTGTGTPSPCVANATTLCLFGGRFGVSASFNAGASGTGNAQVVQLTDDTGYLWFFAAANVELVLKVLDGCPLGGHYWVFAGGLTNVNVVITVTDSQTGATKTYTNPQSVAFQPIQDTAAFSTCP
jgi:pseudomonalisin